MNTSAPIPCNPARSNTSRFVLAFIGVVLSPLLFSVPVQAELNGLIETSAGYDDNASLSPAPRSSGFGLYHIRLNFRYVPDDLPLSFTLFTDDAWQQYFRLADNYYVKTGASVIWQTFGGRLLSGFFSEASAYRDELNTSDERDEILTGFQIDWLASARIDLSIRQTWNWINYRNPTLFYSPPNSRPIPQKYTENIAVPMRSIEQDDSRRSTALRCRAYLTSELQTDVSLEYHWCNSSVDVESYTAAGFSASLSWTPDFWEISPIVEVKRFDYDVFQLGVHREDIRKRISLNISRFIEPFELFFRIDWIENDSDIEPETYQRTVTQCGISWSF